MNTSLTGPTTTPGRLDAAPTAARDRGVHVRQASKERNHVQAPASVPIRIRI
jgi:hypothetical protein